MTPHEPLARPRVVAEGIPTELRALDQWVCWRSEKRDGKWTKVPYIAGTDRRADSTDPSTWSSFAAAFAAWRRGGYDGIGFVVRADDPYVFVDLDHCIDQTTRALKAWAGAIVARLASHTYVTPSGEGLRVVVRGKLPPAGRKRGDVEMYDDARFLTITGERLAGMPEEIGDRQEDLAALHGEVFPPAPKVEKSVHVARLPLALDDGELLARARAAKNGAKLDRLLAGDVGDYPSASEADFALAGLLAFWTDDAEQVKRIMRSSALVRPKWDTLRGGRTYLDVTVDEALRRPHERYRPGSPASPASAAPSFHDETGLDPCLGVRAEADQLRARIAELERENAELRQAVALRDRLLAENAEAQRRAAKVLANPRLKTEAPVALATARIYASAAERGQADPDGFVRVNVREVAKESGRSPSTVSRSLRTLKAAGAIHYEPRFNPSAEHLDRSTGAFEKGRNESWVKFTGPVPEVLDRLATYVPPRAPHGGYRRRCPKHRDAPLVHRWYCSVCGELVDEETVPPRSFQDETIAAPLQPDSSVSNTSRCNQVETTRPDKAQRLDDDPGPWELEPEDDDDDGEVAGYWPGPEEPPPWPARAGADATSCVQCGPSRKA